MAKKNVWVEVDLTWTGTDEVWNETGALWTDDIIQILKRITVGGSRGGLRKKQDTWNAWDKIGEKNKKKIVRVIMTLKGVRHIAEQDINEYKVTIEDIKLVLEEYEKFKVTIENVKII